MLQDTGCQVCLTPLSKAGANKQFFCRKCPVAEDLCLQVREPQEEVNRLCGIWGNEQDCFFSEMLQSQDPQEFQTLAAAEEQVDPEPCQVIRPGSAEEKAESQSLYVPAAMVILFSPLQVSISYDSLILWT